MFLFDWFYGILTSLGLRQKEAKILFLGLDNAEKTELLQKYKDSEFLYRFRTQSRGFSNILLFCYYYFLFFKTNRRLVQRCRRIGHRTVLVRQDQSFVDFMRLVRDQGIVDSVRLVLPRYQPTQYSTSEELRIGKINFKVFDLGGHQTALRVLRDYNAKVDAVVYLVDTFDKAESRRELHALLSDESLANVPFLILSKALISEELLLNDLGLTNLTTGKGNVNLGDINVRPLELFMFSYFCGVIEDCALRDGFVWLSQYI